MKKKKKKKTLSNIMKKKKKKTLFNIMKKNHYQVMLIAESHLTHSHHRSLFSIAPNRSSRLHPVSTLS